MECIARQIDGFAQFVEHDRGRAAADVQVVEVVAQILQHEHFLAHALEVRARHLLVEPIAIEAAERAETLAERHMHVQHVTLAGLRLGNAGFRSRNHRKVILRHPMDDLGQNTFGKHAGSSCKTRPGGRVVASCIVRCCHSKTTCVDWEQQSRIEWTSCPRV